MVTSYLQDIATLLRRDVLTMTTTAGSGHPTTCLSCAEIIATLFFTEIRYDPTHAAHPENDEFILSKGHAAPILYAALHHAGCIPNNLNTLRQYGSALEGHPVPTLPWIKVATGSLGQGLSIGVGMALAAQLQKRTYRTYVLLGDSESLEGSIAEAAQLASHYNLTNLCAILDVNRLGQSNETLYGHNLQHYKKIFEAYGWNTILIDGHNLNHLKTAFAKARANHKKPTIIIAKTLKGKGVSFLENKEGWHGKVLTEEQLHNALHELPNVTLPTIRITKPSTRAIAKHTCPSAIPTIYKQGDNIATREAYGNVLVKLARLDQRVIALDAEVKNSTGAQALEKTFPKQFIEAYIAEQNMIGMSLGLAVKGFHVYASTFAAFLARSHDQLRMAALSRGTFTCVGSHCGTSIGEDGPSQMGLEDLALFRSLPGSTVLYPADAVATEQLLLQTLHIPGIKYIRTTRAKTPIIYSNRETFPLGGFNVVRRDKNARLTIATAGITLHEALKAHETLQQQAIPVNIVDCYSIKPFDAKKFINHAAKNGKHVLVVEDHYAEGGLGEMLMHACAGTGITFTHNAITKIPHSGPWPTLAEPFNITSKGILKTIKKII